MDIKPSDTRFQTFGLLDHHNVTARKSRTRSLTLGVKRYENRSIGSPAKPFTPIEEPFAPEILQGDKLQDENAPEFVLAVMNI